MSEVRFPVIVDREMDLSRGLARKSLKGTSILDYDEFVVSDNWTWGDDDRYAFAMGIIRTIERRLISSDRFLRLSNARNTTEIFSMLADTDYAGGYQDELLMISGSDSDDVDIERVLYREAERVKKLIDNLTKDPMLTDILFVRDDYLNLKLALKGILGGVDIKDHFAPFGLLPPTLIYQEAGEPERSQLLPPHLKDAAIGAIKTYGDTKNPMDIDRIVDAGMFEYILDRAAADKVFFLYRLITMEIDLVNIITFFRLKWMEKPLSSLSSSLIEGGRLPFEVFMEFFPREIDDIEIGFFADEAYREFIAEGGLHLKNENSFVGMESLVDRELLKMVDREKEINFGVEILIAYYYKKHIEMRRLRTVVIGKQNGLSPREIKTRLGYVGK